MTDHAVWIYWNKSATRRFYLHRPSSIVRSALSVCYVLATSPSWLGPYLRRYSFSRVVMRSRLINMRRRSTYLTSTATLSSSFSSRTRTVRIWEHRYSETKRTFPATKNRNGRIPGSFALCRHQCEHIAVWVFVGGKFYAIKGLIVPVHIVDDRTWWE